MVSLDGYGEVHDRVRGKPGNFERADKVIDFASESNLVDSLRVGCTIIKENVYGLADLFEYCQEKGVYVKYRLGIPHQRLYTKTLVGPYDLTFKEKYHVAEFLEGLLSNYEKNINQSFFYRSLIDQIILGAPRKAGCDWQHRGATITSKGELLYCAVESKSLGDVRFDDCEKIYFGNKSYLQEILSSKCESCVHDYVGILPRNQVMKKLLMTALSKTGTEDFFRRIYSSSMVGNKFREYRFRHRYRLLKSISCPYERVHDFSSKRVLICGWYGTETLGDKAILAGIIHALQSTLGSVEITLVSLHPYVSQMTMSQMNELKGVDVIAAEEAIRSVSEMDYVVFGGGPLMAGIDQIAEMEAIFSKASQNSIPTVIAGCGVGPLGDSWHNESIKRILSMSSLRIYRDEKSKQLAEQLGIDTKMDSVADDPAFSWLKEQSISTSLPFFKSGKTLLLGLRDFPYRQYATALDDQQCLAMKARYESETLAALEQLVERNSDLIIRPLPMCTNHFGGDDRWFYRRLFRGRDSLKSHLDLSLLGPELSPVEYCQAFREADVVLGMRFHSIVFALGLGTPTVVIDYTLGKGKVASLAQHFNLPMCDIGEISAPFIVRQVEWLLAADDQKGESFSPCFGKVLSKSLASLADGKKL